MLYKLVGLVLVMLYELVGLGALMGDMLVVLTFKTLHPLDLVAYEIIKHVKVYILLAFMAY